MADLKPGKDYHLAEVVRTVAWPQGPRGFFAHCDACGWVGPQRGTKAAADEDAYAHDETENDS